MWTEKKVGTRHKIPVSCMIDPVIQNTKHISSSCHFLLVQIPATLSELCRVISSNNQQPRVDFAKLLRFLSSSSINSTFSNHRAPCRSSEPHQVEFCHWLAPVVSPPLHSSADPSSRAPKMLSKLLIELPLMRLSKPLRKKVGRQLPSSRVILVSTSLPASHMFFL